jgi:hypothetical protein
LSTAVSTDAGGRTAVVTPPAAQQAAGATTPRRRTRWWLELLTIAWLCWVYDLVLNLQPLRAHVALGHGRSLLDLERTLGIDPEKAVNLWLAGQHALGLAISDYYDNAHFAVTLGVLAWLWWRHTDAYRPLRDALVLVNLLGFVVFWLYPVAPPRMLGGFTDVVSSTHAFGSWHTGALASHANEFAAMPSLHMAWAIWCAVAIWQVTERPWARALGIAHVALTAFAVLATANHYLLDLVAGALVMALAFALVRAGGELARAVRAGRIRRPARARPDAPGDADGGHLGARAAPSRRAAPSA